MAARVIPFAFHCGRFTGRFPLVITRCHYSTLGVPSGNSPGVHPTPGNHSHGNSRGGGDSDGFKCWQIHSYGGPNELQLSTSSRQPKISSPSEVLVKVKAASVNPIDLAMTKGLNKMNTKCNLSTTVIVFVILLKWLKKYNLIVFSQDMEPKQLTFCVISPHYKRPAYSNSQPN